MTRIVVKAVVEGTHNWPECDIGDVMFLRHPHRHLFHITAKKAVSHENRQVEIIMLKRSITDYLHGRYGKACDFGERSCETLARELLDEFGLSYCQVLEDNENGAETERTL